MEEHDTNLKRFGLMDNPQQPISPTIEVCCRKSTPPGAKILMLLCPSWENKEVIAF